VKIVDFGVAHYIPTTRILQRRTLRPIDPELFPPRNLIRTHGTPFFQAPEIVDDKTSRQTERMATYSYDSISAAEDVPGSSSSSVEKRRPPITSAIDIWSLGVTFYCFLFGHVPFVGDPPGSGFALITEIMNSDFKVDDFMGFERLPTEGRHPVDKFLESAVIVHLLERMLDKNPKCRIKLVEIKVGDKKHNDYWFWNSLSGASLDTSGYRKPKGMDKAHNSWL
jgi:serine/threonine protein kinase